MTASSSTPTEPLAVPAGVRIGGRLRVPSSKSQTHRFLNLALLSGAPLTVERPLIAEDTLLFLAALRGAGWEVGERLDTLHLTPPPGRRQPQAPPLPRQPPPQEIEIFCGNAGTMLRFLVASLSALPGRWRLDGVPRLRQRPVGPLVEALRRLGARIVYGGAPGFVPLAIQGGTLAGGATSIDAGESSQYLSALLMAALAAPAPVTVEVSALTSAPYVEVTLAAAARFGGRIEPLAADGGGTPRGYRVWPSELAAVSPLRVEGDASAACYPAAAAALTGGAVTLSGVPADSLQGDRRFFDLLAAMGAAVAWDSAEEVTVRGGELSAIECDLSGMPDQVPTLAALAPFARGVTRITNVAHLRIKESDRLAAMAGELRRLGVEVEEGPDYLRIAGVWHDREPPAEPVEVDPRGDHRIAMSLALVGLRRPGVIVRNPEVVAKSYPDFWKDLLALSS
ncbi:MAG TPA: 3-phosphoshikimate 1-carboxyvinyltransferase [Thermoanaerobaculia bacterium]|nr:3-phosphoshikimate 1-carboxyvinyltransferase [Thermoanaerobaculia bacterium]